MTPIRLQKIIADAGLASRRKAEQWIAAGQVKVNGRVVKTLGTTADPEQDRIQVRGRLLPKAEEKVYLILNKPTHCLTTVEKDSKGRQTVMDFVKGVKSRVFPVGRLDYNTQGLLLFTNDGDLSRKLLAPRYRVPRTYMVKVRGVPDEKVLKRLKRGVRLDNRPTAPLEARIDRLSGKNCFLVMTLVEGRSRHIKRVCEQVGHPVIRLKRTHFGTLNLTGLPLGAYRFLNPREVRRLRALVQDAVK